jgi:NADH dehydrogenase (ubiquinone) Fe-S protein 4
MFSRRLFSKKPGNIEISKVASNLKGEFNPNSAIEPVSEAPKQIFAERRALIYRPARNVMQSGSAQTKHWRLEFDSNVPRWENPLMGWSSSRDPIQGVSLKFAAQEEAVAYAKEQGWAFEVKSDWKPTRKPKSYAENFTYSSSELKIIKTK